MYAKDILGRKGSDVISVKPQETLQAVLQVFSERKIGFAVISDGKGGVAGTISERDICHAMSETGAEAVTTEVNTVMRLRIVSCTLEDNLARITAMMTGNRTRHVLVMDDGEILGIVSIGDVVKYRLDEALMAEESMRDYIEGTGYSYHPHA